MMVRMAMKYAKPLAVDAVIGVLFLACGGMSLSWHESYLWFGFVVVYFFV